MDKLKAPLSIPQKMIFVFKVCIKTLCHLCKIVPIKNKKRLMKSLWFIFNAYRADFLIDQLLKNSKSFSAKTEKKNIVLKKNGLFASKCTYSD